MSPCAKPVSFEALVAWWTGDLPADEAAAIEDHVFACDECAAACDRFARLAEGLRAAIPPIISHAHRDRLVAAGARVRLTPVEAGVDARARFAPDVDLLVHALHGDFSRAERVDVDIVHDGAVRASFEHVPFDAKSGEVLVACQRHYQTMFAGDPTFRVHAVEGGERRIVGDYFVLHEWA